MLTTVCAHCVYPRNCAGVFPLEDDFRKKRRSYITEGSVRARLCIHETRLGRRRESVYFLVPTTSVLQLLHCFVFVCVFVVNKALFLLAITTVFFTGIACFDMSCTISEMKMCYCICRLFHWCAELFVALLMALCCVPCTPCSMNTQQTHCVPCIGTHCICCGKAMCWGVTIPSCLLRKICDLKKSFRHLLKIEEVSLDLWTNMISMICCLWIKKLKPREGGNKFLSFFAHLSLFISCLLGITIGEIFSRRTPSQCLPIVAHTLFN